MALHSRGDFGSWIGDQSLSRHILSQSNDTLNLRTLNFLPFSASRNLNRPYRRGIAESARTFARADSGTGDLHRGYPHPALCHLEHQSERNSGGVAGVEEKGQCEIDIPTASFRHNHRSTWRGGLGFRQTEWNRIQAGRNAKPGINPAFYRRAYKTQLDFQSAKLQRNRPTALSFSLQDLFDTAYRLVLAEELGVDAVDALGQPRTCLILTRTRFPTLQNSHQKQEAGPSLPRGDPAFDF